MKKIKLTKGHVALVDDADFDWLNQYKWCYTGSGYAVRQENNLYVYMHRFILDTKKGQYVDHANHNKLDNRRSNIRICTQSQNLANRSAKGIQWIEERKRWKARIQVNGKEIYIGRFLSKEDARRAYKKAKVKYFGEFAGVQSAV